jgi:hypothetical protein
MGSFRLDLPSVSAVIATHCRRGSPRLHCAPECFEIADQRTSIGHAAKKLVDLSWRKRQFSCLMHVLRGPTCRPAIAACLNEASDMVTSAGPRSMSSGTTRATSNRFAKAPPSKGHCGRSMFVAVRQMIPIQPVPAAQQSPRSIASRSLCPPQTSTARLGEIVNTCGSACHALLPARRVGDHADVRHRLGYGQPWGRIRGGRTPGVRRR